MGDPSIRSAASTRRRALVALRKAAVSLIVWLALTATALPASAAEYGAQQFYPNNPAPAAPPAWSYDPYTSGLGPCPERLPGDDKCADRIAPTAGQPNYWVRCAPG